MKLEDIPQSIQLVWHGANDRLNLEYFLKSPIPWAEGDVRGDGQGRAILRHDPFDTHPLRSDEELFPFEEWLNAMCAAHKKIKIDLKEGLHVLDRVVALVKDLKIPETDLWFSVNLKDVAIDDFSRLRPIFPQAILQSTIPLRFMYQFMSPEERTDWIALNRRMGVTRLSASWHDEPSHEEIKILRQEGFEINLYHVDSITDFKEAVALAPEAITSDFHLPEWNLFGRGSGENGCYLDP